MPKKQRASQRKSLANAEQQSRHRKRMRWILFSSIAVVVLAAIGVGAWSYYHYRIKPYQPVAIRFNDTTFDLRYFIDMLKLSYGHVPPSDLAAFSSEGDQVIEQFTGYVRQQIIQNETIKQGSAALGVQIDRSVIEDKLKSLGQSINDVNVDVLMAGELIDQQVPSSQPQAHVQAMLLESEAAAQEAQTRLNAGESFGDVAVDMSKTPIQMIINGDMGWVTPREADVTVDSTEFGSIIQDAETGVLLGPLYDATVTKDYGYWVVKVVEKKELSGGTLQTIHASGILVGTEQEAENVIARLNAGEDFEELAKELSQAPGVQNNGADMGWITKSDTPDSFDVLFDMPIGSISGPIGNSRQDTKGGYWLFNVLEKDGNRVLTSSQKDLLQTDLLKKFIDELMSNSNYNVEILLTPEMRTFAINEVLASLGSGAVMIRTGSLEGAVSGVPYNQQLEVYGNTKGNTWSLTDGNLPTGLSLDSATGLISGTPALSGVASFTIRVTSSKFYWEQKYVLTVHFSVSISTTSLPDAQAGKAYDTQIAVMGDSQSYTWSLVGGSLPDGMNLDPVEGFIFGVPATAGSYTFTVEVTDGLSQADQELTLTVLEPQPPES